MRKFNVSDVSHAPARATDAGLDAEPELPAEPTPV